MQKKILEYKNWHLVGIKGGGMTALALLLKSMNKNITGSDSSEKFYTDKVLKKHQIKFFENFSPANIPVETEVVVHSTAYDPNTNTECIFAKTEKLILLTYPEALAELINSKLTIAIAGTHGKTTTTAWLAYVLDKCGFKPSALVGSNVPQFGGNTLAGKSDLFLVETDEYQNKFKYYNPQAIILNNIDWDHPDYFASANDYLSVFKEYIAKIPAKGFLVAGIDNKNVFELSKNFSKKLITFGLERQADWQAKNIQIKKETIFDVYWQQRLWHSAVKISLFGDFNVLNALAVIATAVELGANKEKILSALYAFSGTERRFEKKGAISNSVIYDDFAHHPGEIKPTLSMVKKLFPEKNIIVVFHPHTFTRTLKLLTDFCQSFIDADEVLLLDIYGSAREKQGGIDAETLTAEINKVSKNAKYIKNIDSAVAYLQKKLNENNVIITMGAGDVWRVGTDLLNLKHD